MVHQYRQPDYTNVCGQDNGQCSHTCVAMPDLHPTRVTCGCPPDLVLDEDNKTCKKITSMDNSSIKPINADKIEAASQIEAVPLPPDNNSYNQVGIIIGASSIGALIIILVSFDINDNYKQNNFLGINFLVSQKQEVQACGDCEI